MPELATIAELDVDPLRCRVHAEGWQSWTPTTGYRLGQRQHRSASALRWTMGYGGSRPPPPDPSIVQGDGLLAVDPGTGGDVVLVGARSASGEVPLVRCEQVGGRTLRVTAGAGASLWHRPASGGLAAALAWFADRFAAASGVAGVRPAPTIWSSWYQYFDRVTEADVDENLAAIAERELPVDVIQLDDGYQRELGDWLDLSGRFASLPGLVDRIRAAGRRAGIWVAPFLAGARSRVAAEHPGWLVRSPDGAPLVAAVGWGQTVHVLDPTHPGVRDYLRAVFAWFTQIGIGFFKLDFLYAGALDGRRHDPEPASVHAYRDGLRHIRGAAGEGAYLLGCGAPLLPSVGLVDAMRVSADTSPRWPAQDGDLSLPGGESPLLSVPARAYQHGRYWVNDPDCLLLRPDVDHRERRAELVGRYGGLRGSSDRIAALDRWGLDRTVALLADVPPPQPFDLP